MLKTVILPYEVTRCISGRGFGALGYARTPYAPKNLVIQKSSKNSKSCLESNMIKYCTHIKSLDKK